MKMHARTVVLAAAASLVAGGAFAQNAAPRDNPSTEVGGATVSIEYGRPALGERTLDELLKELPEDRMWRTGSEQVTTLTTSGDIMIGDQKVPAGKYSLYLHCPAEGAYSLVVNSNLGQPLENLAKVFNFTPPAGMEKEPWPYFAYDKEIADQEVARAAMTQATVEAPADRFTITFGPAPDGAMLVLSWGDRAWSVGIRPAS